MTKAEQKTAGSDEGLTLETSLIFQISHGRNSTSKTTFLCLTLPQTQHHSFFKN